MTFCSWTGTSFVLEWMSGWVSDCGWRRVSVTGLFDLVQIGTRIFIVCSNALSTCPPFGRPRLNTHTNAGAVARTVSVMYWCRYTHTNTHSHTHTHALSCTHPWAYIYRRSSIYVCRSRYIPLELNRLSTLTDIVYTDK